MINVLIICGGQSAEHEVSLQSTKSVLAAVDRDKFSIVLAGIDRGGRWNRYDPSDFLTDADDPARIALAHPGEELSLVACDKAGYVTPVGGHGERIRIDAAFPVLHGTFGEDGAVQGLLKMANIPCVGCDVLGSAVAMDKEVAKKLLQAEDLPVARGVIFHMDQRDDIRFEDVRQELGLPLFIKPANLGSSVGITKAKDRASFDKGVADAFAYDVKIIIEEFIQGREIECAVLGNEAPIASVPGEIVPQDDWYSYEAKYIDGKGAVLVAPAELDDETVGRVRDLAVRSFKALCGKGMARVDVFLTEDGRLIVNEMNTIPGFTKISMYPRLWALTGIPYAELIERLIDLAIERFEWQNRVSTNFNA